VYLCVSSFSYTENHRDPQRKNHHYLQAATALVIRFGADWRHAGGLYNIYLGANPSLNTWRRIKKNCNLTNYECQGKSIDSIKKNRQA
jgi:hypothetical protein